MVSQLLEDILSLALILIVCRDWYTSAQSTRPMERAGFSTFDTIAEEKSDDEDRDPASLPQEDGFSPQSSKGSNGERPHQKSPPIEAAHKELRLYELLAFSSCFLFPAIGAWLLHAIRAQLSRPSEGLVSNYNLTVFLLASEIRPVSHLVKMVQARTLFLQRVIREGPNDDEQRPDLTQVIELVKRVEELEAHVAVSVEGCSKNTLVVTDTAAEKTTAQAISETRKSLQPDLDALNRAVRRYEKRTTISSLQTEARLQDLETRLKDVVVLAAAAQRNVESQPKNFALILLNWMCAAVVLPAQYIWFLLHLPQRAMQLATDYVCQFFGLRRDKFHRQSRRGDLSKVPDRRLNRRYQAT